jgi:ATPase family AAA domain-containing protein 3A/B
MAAKRLARTAGLDYAILTGGDVAPLGAAAAPALHSLFDWAERSPRGLLLFVDEADAFLGRRGPAMGEATRGALNAALARTGDQSPDFCLVLATNRPEDLDPAVLDRMDEALLFPLPGEGERASILKIYVDAYLRRTGPALAAAAAAGAPRRPLSVRLAASLRGRGGAADAITLDGVDDAAVAAAAAATDGFSGRELAKLVAAAQAAAYASPTATLTRGRWDEVVAEKVAEHAARRAMVEGKGW